MKKIHYSALAVLAILAAASCTREEIDGASGPALVEKTFVAENCDATRTYIDTTGSVLLWEEGDDIAVFDNLSAAAHKFTISGIDSTKAVFSGEVTEGATDFYAVYPYSSAESRDGANLVACLSATQRLGSHNAGRGAFVAVGKVNDGKISFQNVFGRIKVDVTCSDISEIVVCGSNLAGKASFNSADGSLLGTVAGTGSVTLLPKEGDSAFAPGTYYLSLLPGTTPAGEFSVTMKRPVVREGALAYSASGTAAGAVTVKQKSGINFADIDTRVEWTLHLGSKDELLAWNNAYVNWKPNDKVFLDADVNLLGEAWEGHAFAGVFDGQNHTIDSLCVTAASADAGFFTLLGGTLRNVTFGNPDGMGGSVTCTADSANVGIIAVMSDCARVSNVTNYVNVTATGAKTAFAGGVAGLCASSDSIIGCRNFARIQAVACAGTANAASVGGIAGRMAGECSIVRFENSGEIYSDCYGAKSSKTPVALGGILGESCAGGSLQNCSNYGNLTYDNDLTLADTLAIQRMSVRAGGVLGACTAVPMKAFSSCVCGSAEKSVVISYDAIYAHSFYAGGLVATCSVTTPVTDCKSYTTFTKNGWAAYEYYGGAVGHISSGDAGTLVRDTVNVNITVKGVNKTASGIRAGLFVGNIAAIAKFENCHADGTIYLNPDRACLPRLGGFVGYLSSATASFTDCSASDFTITAKSKLYLGDGSTNANLYVGGFAASQSKGSITYTNCRSKGNLITLSYYPKYEYYGGFCGSSATASFTGCSACCNITQKRVSGSKSYTGAFLGYSSSLPTVASCSVGAVTINETVLSDESSASGYYYNLLTGTSSKNKANVDEVKSCISFDPSL